MCRWYGRFRWPDGVFPTESSVSTAPIATTMSEWQPRSAVSAPRSTSCTAGPERRFGRPALPTGRGFRPFERYPTRSRRTHLTQSPERLNGWGCNRFRETPTHLTRPGWPVRKRSTGVRMPCSSRRTIRGAHFSNGDFPRASCWPTATGMTLSAFTHGSLGLDGTLQGACGPCSSVVASRARASTMHFARGSTLARARVGDSRSAVRSRQATLKRSMISSSNLGSRSEGSSPTRLS